MKWERTRSALPAGPFPFEAAALGLNAVDRVLHAETYPPRGGKVAVNRVEVLPGGQSATAMAACRALGMARVRYAGKVGDDDFGRLQLESLDRAGVDRAWVRVEPGVPSQWADIVVDAVTGERTIFWQRSDRLNFRPGELADDAVLCAPVLLLDGYDGDNALRLARGAKARGILVVTDLDRVFPWTPDLLGFVDVCISSREFPSELTGEPDLATALEGMARRCPGVVGATLGPDGVAVWAGGSLHVVPACPVRAVDTTGAGDVFHGALVFGLARGWPLGRTLRFANAAAALNCTATGARGKLVSAAEALRFAGLDGEG
ncbi:MAG: hypothetical protein KA419_07100 [Acidobacteria bacterium]|nr:hypothetical protein [Acidobacteriota bacterium]